jgi:putative transposase
LVDKKASMSIQQQCKLLGVPRSSYYHKPKRRVSRVEELLMQAIDRIYMQEPSYGSRRLRDELAKLGYKVGRKRVRRLMRVMVIELPKLGQSFR